MAAAITLAARMGFDLEINYARRTLRPCGEIDATTAPKLLDAANAFMSSAVGDLIIDLAQVTFADSALLHALLDIRTDLRMQGARLWLVNEPPNVVRLFQLSGFIASGTGTEAPRVDAPASRADLHSVPDGEATCEIGQAIAILMSRYPITYTKAFAAMLASTDRTQRSLPELAASIVTANSRQLRAEPRRVLRSRSRVD